jgi:hypothetical protein
VEEAEYSSHSHVKWRRSEYLWGQGSDANNVIVPQMYEALGSMIAINLGHGSVMLATPRNTECSKSDSPRAAARKSTAKNPDDSEIAPEQGQWLVLSAWGFEIDILLPCNRLTTRYLQIARRTAVFCDHFAALTVPLAGHEQQKVNLC